MSIQNQEEKINPGKGGAGPEIVSFDEEGRIEDRSVIKRYFLVLVMILGMLLSFGLGRLTAGEGRDKVNIIYDPSLSELRAISGTSTSTKPLGALNAAAAAGAISDTTVVASSKGTKYHYLHCPGAKSIKTENKITFKTPELAQKSGYALAGNCKPK